MNPNNYTASDWLYRKVLLSPLGLDRENSLVLWILLIYALLMSGSFYIFDGNVPLVAGIMYMSFALLLSIFRIDYSLYMFMLSVMVFDQYAIPGFDSITRDVAFFSNLKEISYVPFFEAGMISPFEIHVIFLTFALIIHLSVRRDFNFKPIPVWGAFLFFFLCLTGSFIYGLRGGGDVLVALWEVRALFYLCVMYVMTAQIINTKKQVYILFWVFIIGITFKAFQGVGRFVELGFTTGGFDVLTNHEDPVFMVTLFILLIGFIVYRTGHVQRNWIFIFMLVLLLGFYVAQRRASYASLMVSISTLIVLLPFLKQVQFMKYFLPILVAAGFYGTAFWNDTGTMGRPVQMIKSGFVEPELETNFRDYSSNLYRNIEDYNLARTVVNNPVTGTGFGKRYDQPIPMVEIRFPLRDYIPHNQIYWIYVKMGAIGFFAFWFFFNCFVAKGTQVFTRLKDPYLKAVTIVIIIAVINQMVVSYYDLQLTYYRNMLYLGCLMGLLPVIQKIHRENEAAEDNTEGSQDE